MLLFEFLLRLSAILKLDFLKSPGKSGSIRYEIRQFRLGITVSAMFPFSLLRHKQLGYRATTCKRG